MCSFAAKSLIKNIAMQKLSSSAIFHYTDKIEWIKDILDKGYLTPKYCEERFPKKTVPIKRILIAMKCFCDIPLSQINNHRERYGSYALGFSKDWAIKNGIAPILYFHEKSKQMVQLVGNLDKVYNETKKFETRQPDEDILKELSPMVCFSKPYEGKDIKKKKTVRFYDEREWRYAPTLSTNITKDSCIPLLPSIKESERKMIQDKVDEKIHLKFSPEDLEYIIVSKKEEVFDIINILCCNKNYGESFIKKNAHKILTMDQIRNDF